MSQLTLLQQFKIIWFDHRRLCRANGCCTHAKFCIVIHPKTERPNFLKSAKYQITSLRFCPNTDGMAFEILIYLQVQ
jgi:hypothetical protein